MSLRIAIVHGSQRGYGLMIGDQVVAGNPQGVLKYEKDLPVDLDKLEFAINNYKNKEKPCPRFSSNIRRLKSASPS